LNSEDDEEEDKKMSPEELACYNSRNEGRREGHLERIHTDEFAGAAEGREGNSNIDDEDDAKPPENNAKWRCEICHYDNVLETHICEMCTMDMFNNTRPTSDYADANNDSDGTEREDGEMK
jgi:hypothetical protein